MVLFSISFILALLVSTVVSVAIGPLGGPDDVVAKLSLSNFGDVNNFLERSNMVLSEAYDKNMRKKLKTFDQLKQHLRHGRNSPGIPAKSDPDYKSHELAMRLIRSIFKPDRTRRFRDKPIDRKGRRERLGDYEHALQELLDELDAEREEITRVGSGRASDEIDLGGPMRERLEEGIHDHKLKGYYLYLKALNDAKLLSKFHIGSNVKAKASYPQVSAMNDFREDIKSSDNTAVDPNRIDTHSQEETILSGTVPRRTTP